MRRRFFRTPRLRLKIISLTLIYSFLLVSVFSADCADALANRCYRLSDTLAPHITLGADSLRSTFIRYSDTGRQRGLDLEVTVREIRLSNVKHTPLEKLDEEIENAQAILSTISQEELLTGLRRLPGQESLQWRDLSKQVFISFFEEGAAKLVFKIEFVKNDGQVIELVLVMKGAKFARDIAPEETRDLQRLTEAANRHAPLFIHEFARDGQERIWFLEEFIAGPTVEQLKKEAKLEAGIVQNIISALLSISRDLTNQMPFDFHGGNFIVREGQVVMVDIGKDRRAIIGEADKRNPHAQTQNRVLFLALLIAHYGVYEKGVSPDANKFIFDAIINDGSLNAENELAGREVIETAYQYLINNGRAQMAKMIFKKAKHPFRSWGVNRKNMQPMADFVAVLESHLRHYLVKNKMLPLAGDDVLTAGHNAGKNPLSEHRALETVGQSI